MTRTRAFIAALGLTAGVATGALFMVNSGYEAPRELRQGGDEVVVQLDCPEEDSCDVDYDGELNKWVITQTSR